MEAPVCGFRRLAGSPSASACVIVSSAACDGHGPCYWGCRASFRLLQMALLYVAVICIIWAFPPVYYRLSETSQTVVFTLVDSAAAELQQRVAPANASDGPSLTDNLTVIKSAADNPAAAEVTAPVLSGDNITATESDDNEEHQKYVVRAEPKVLEQRPLGQVTQPPPQAAAKEDSGPFVNDSLEEVQASKISEDQGPHDPGKAETEHTLPEDIPSFSEWRLKHLAEDEQKKRDQSNATSPPVTQSRPAGSSKLHSKNYASPDCGAKIVAANPEATSASSVLSPSRDEYLLNTCTSRIWFVVELCEAIQAKKIEIANFELFSSPPREFSVYVSDRFPTRDWQNVGNFVAEDERTIQSFNLHPHLFGKFIKVEFHSHYGSEHFCPVSLFRAYGTSEFEVLKTVDQVLEPDENIDDDDDEDDDEPLDVGKGEPTTIFDNARYAILSIVTKAAEALGKSGDSRNNTEIQNKSSNSVHPQVPSAEPCRSPRHIVVCDNCSDSLYGDVFKLLSCEEENLHALIESSFISDTIRDSKLCTPYGLDFTSRKLGAPFPLRPGKMFGIRQVDPGGYIMALFPPKYIAALCNMLAVLEKRVALNVSEELSASPVLESAEKEDTESHFVEDNLENVLKPVPTCTLTSSLSTEPCNINRTAETIDSDVVPATVVHIDSSVAAQINPTKTLEKVDDDVAPSLLTASKVMPSSETIIAELPQAPDKVLQVSSVIHLSENANGSAQTKTVEIKEQLADSSASQVGDFGLVLEESVTMPVSAEEPAQDNLSLDSLLNELKDLERVVDSSSSPAVATTMAPPSLPTQQVQKESVFVRLANKIKALERNMSLSGQYLEELSRRYKKQVEDMQRSFNRTLSVVLDQNRKAEEREKRRLEEIVELKQQLAVLSTTVETIVNERTSWAATGYALMQPLFFIVVFAVMLQYLKHHANHSNVQLNEENQRKLSIGYRSRKLNRFEKRRRSVEGVSGHETRTLKKRRPSEETLVSGSYYELLIPDNQASEVDGGVRTVLRLENKRRRRKKKDSLPKSDYSSDIQKTADTINDAQFREKSPEANNLLVINGFHATDNQELKPEAEQLPNMTPCKTSDNIQYSSAESLLKTAGSVVQYSDSSDSSLHNRGQALPQLEVLYSNRQVNDKIKLSESVPVLGNNNGSVKHHHGLSPKIRNLSAPLFMKTAMAARSGRRSSEQSSTLQAKLKSDNWEWYSSRKGNGSSHSVTATHTVQNGDGSSHVPSDSLGRTGNVSSTPDVIRKESSKKQTGGLKKIGSWRIQSLFKN